MLFQILSYIVMALQVYAFLIFMRIVFSWLTLSSPIFYGVYDFLGKITNPYLNLFRFKFLKLKFAMLDFSPLFGILILQVLTGLLQNFIIYKRVSLGSILGYVLYFLIGIVNFILGVLMLIILLRLVLLLFHRDNELSNTIDNIIYGKTYRVWGFFFKMRIIRYSTLLSMSLFSILAFILFNKFILGGYLVGILSRLPF